MSVPRDHDHELDLDKEKQAATTQVAGVEPEIVNSDIDHEYLNAPKKVRFFRGVFLQMILFGALSFVGPSMNDAIGNLGGGGLSTPYLANLASCLNYALSATTALFGGPIINKLGIRNACIIAGFCMCLTGTGFYVRAKYAVDGYLLAARAIGGITSALLYVGESTAMLSYPFIEDRGKYLGIWAAMRNSGTVIGGAINFANNSQIGVAGGIQWTTYLIFIGFEVSGALWALLLSPTSKVRRPDGSRVPTSGDISWAAEFKALWKHLQHPRTLLLFFPAFYSFFCGGVYGTYLSLHFTVRARALSSLIFPIATIVSVLGFGLILDNKSWPQKRKAWFAFLCWAIPQGAVLIWTGIEHMKFAQDGQVIAFDYQLTPRRWAEAYFPYFIMLTSSFWCQMSLYWILGTFSSDVKSSSRTGGLFRGFETLGQAVSYGINANTGDKKIPLYVMCVIFVLTMPSMVALIRLVPAKPAEVDDVAEERQEEAVLESQAGIAGVPAVPK